MRLVERFWTTVTYIVSLVTFSGVETPGTEVQSPLFDASLPAHLDPGPVFKPPTGSRGDVEGHEFECDYSAMQGFEYCSTPENRTCWLINKSTGKEYTVNTSYETDTPIGIHRTYHINITDGEWNGDGINFAEAKLFNNTYPGPWLQACWGDNITVVVHNKMAHNGTSVHWHGIRQLNTTHMDGVNGVTQCPIAPEDDFTYTWRVMQYGSSWYHSHYSAQYADGVVGPMTLHGPSTAPYDEAKFPILMTDWGHNSAFEAIHTELVNKSILLNGLGNITKYDNSNLGIIQIPEPETYYFDSTKNGKGNPKRYLMRLINTAFDSTFVFSIDHHKLQVVGADFVPLVPYKNTSVLVGIGQRYHVIVEADPQPNDEEIQPPSDQNFWIRTWRADCFGFKNPTKDQEGDASFGYEATGILRYNRSSKSRPTSQPWNVSKRCSDETYGDLVPWLPWTVNPKPANAPDGDIIQVEKFDVRYDGTVGPTRFPWGRFSMAGEEFAPLQISYANPTFLHLDYSGKWNQLWAIFDEDYNETDWLYMVIKGGGGHPIHLHGHDFAILQQIENSPWPQNLNLKYDNPPRRDVVLLPTRGYVVIAFKADNPGPWLMHCHIAEHASMGLGLQVMERQHVANEMWPIFPPSERDAAIQYTIDKCNNWNKWWGDCCNWWTLPGENPCSSCPMGQNGFADDSGI